MLVDCILLIDDDKPTNFLHSRILSTHKSFDVIKVAQSGREALAYLEAVSSAIAIKPNVIFLDINMPAMNGWEFLKEFEKLDRALTKGIKIFLVTTSSLPEDMEDAKSNSLVEDLINKPLSFDAIDGLLKKHMI